MRRRERLRDSAAVLLTRVADRLRANGGATIWLNYPPASADRPRWGYGRRPHAHLEKILARHEDAYRSHLEIVARYRDDLLAIDLQPTQRGEPCWHNGWLLGMDTASIYGLVRSWAPANYVEIGSGNSTMVVARARRDGRLGTQITSIDPHPRADINGLCDNVIRQPLEEVDLSLFADLSAGDLVFVDSSHRAFMNSDVTTFYLEVLPELPSGVFVGIHDILWPDDYLPEWRDHWFSEQYLVGAYLLAETPWLVPLLACNYVSSHPELGHALDSLWSDPRLAEVDRRGFCLWMRISR